MKRFVLFATLSLALLFAFSAFATEPLHKVRGGWGTLHGESINTAKALGDTVYLLGNPANMDQWSNGSPPQANGTFEDQFGNENWNGWTHEDLTFSPESYWNVSDFNVVEGNYSMWCGTYAEGLGWDTPPGYGHDWNVNLVFTYEVDDNTLPSTVNWSATVQQDSEVGWDFTYMEVNRAGIWTSLATYDGARTYSFNQTFSYASTDYVGSGANEIMLRIRFASDSNTDDEDGLRPSDGACQVDLISVTVNGTLVDFEDFEDQVSDNWAPVLDPGVGDYAELYSNLQDADPCRSNFSPQVAFIDDGVVVPGTGGTSCVTWCYGPGGWIVNNTGGLMGPDFYINNIIISPVLDWPAGLNGATIEYGFFRHEELGDGNTWPGMFYQWHVRSTADPLTDPIENAAWDNRNFVQYGGPDYGRQREVVTDLLVAGRTQVQLSLRCIEYGYNWGWIGTDGTPAPYFDNAMFLAYPYDGPGISTRDIDIANDNFPEAGDFDFSDLAANKVRFDMARNIAPDDDQRNDPGDSIFFDVKAVVAGSVLDGAPRMYVRMKANDVFEGVRILPPNFTRTLDFFEDGDNLIEGYVEGDTTFTTAGSVVDDRWNFDLPDEEGDAFFFPGDVIHYYIEGKDNLAGTIGTSILPGDTTGFATFDHRLQYDSDFIVRALPTLFSATAGDQPEILWWNDFGDRGGENEWMYALGQLGYREGIDYDIYYTNGPSSGVGNGLGGRATSALLDGYDTMLYTAGDLSVNLLSNGDFENDPSDDLNVVTNWLGRGDKNMFMTGDDLVYGILDAGDQGSAFVNTYFSVNLIDRNILGYIGNQTAAIAKPMAGNGVLARTSEWVCYGGCNTINTFDAIEVAGTASRLAEFTDVNGNTGVYSYAAGIYNVNDTDNARVVMMPYDFMFIYNAPGWVPPAGYEGMPARTVMLEDILNFFGKTGGSPVIGVTPDAVLSVTNFPNPFNPTTTIKLNLPRSGDVSLKVFNVRGELVRTLVNGQMEAGAHDIVWDGKTDRGNQAASGVYFYETRAAGQVKVNKMALVK